MRVDTAPRLLRQDAAPQAIFRPLPNPRRPPSEWRNGEQGHVGLRALPLGEAAEAEGFPATAGVYLQTLADSGEVEIETQRLDPGSGLVYVVCTTTSSQELPGGETVNETPEFLLAWGEPDSEWLFAVSADVPEIRTALVEAFVDAVRSRG